MSDRERKWHFGLLPFTGTGHLTPFLALAQELKRRGHRITFFEKPKIEERVRAAGFDFVSIGDSTCFEKTRINNSAGWSSELSDLRFNLRRITIDIDLYMRESSEALRRSGVDALITNEIALTGPTVAQMLALPYFLISTSVPHRFGWGISPWIYGYRYSRSRLSWLQASCLEVSALRMRGPLRRTIDSHRRRLGFGPVRNILSEYPPLAHIAQLPPCLGRRRGAAPANYFDAGPLVGRSLHTPVPFPWEKLDGRPVVYASLGTTRNVHPFLFRMIAEACSTLNVQVVLTLGNRFDPAEFSNLPGCPIVVKYAPQLELLKIVRIVITHGGANTVIETLLEGKPMIAIPLAYDQPAMAARLTRLHVAEALPIMRLSSGRIRDAIATVLDDSSYQIAAQQLRNLISPIRGAERAATIIESFLADQPDAAMAKGPLAVDCCVAANLG